MDRITPVFVRIQVSKSILENLKINFTENLEDKGNKIKNLKQELLKYKKDQTIALINKRIAALNQKWVVGETTLSKLTYNEKKKRFGDTIPNLMGFEYYKGGIFELLDDPQPVSTKLRKADELETYPDIVSDFDWRNRHGINWNTPIKTQFEKTCYAFTAVAATEALVNLYFNRKIDLDLSEGEVVACCGFGNCEDGGSRAIALNYIKNTGVVNQECFANGNCNATSANRCTNPAEKIKIAGRYDAHEGSEGSERNIKKHIIANGVLSSAIKCWGHAMALSGWGTINVGDSIVDDYSMNKILITANDTNLIGKTYWIFKGSDGTGWGFEGYCYVIIQNLDELQFTEFLGTPVTSLNYSETDIVCEDKDGDGYYYWGIGARPTNIPLTMIEDGNDTNPYLGKMDEYGNLDSSYISSTINSLEYYFERCLYGDLIVESNGTLEVVGRVFFPKNYQIIIKNGGKLIVRENGIIKNANIKVEEGGSLILQNNAVLEKGLNDEINIEIGGTFEFLCGEIKQVN